MYVIFKVIRKVSFIKLRKIGFGCVIDGEIKVYVYWKNKIVFWVFWVINFKVRLIKG